MELVINIDDETYNDIKKGKIYSSFRDVPLESVNAIANGTPLNDVLDKIRAEIKRLPYQRIFGNVSSYSLLDVVIEIIDEYREEQE